MTVQWWKAAGIRAAKTAAQSALRAKVQDVIDGRQTA